MPDLVELAAHLANCQEEEAQAKLKRLQAEEAIVRATGFDMTEGSFTYKDETASGSYKLVLSQPVYSKVDSDGWLKLRRKLPAGHPARSIFRQKFDLDTKAARELQKRDAEAWLQISKVVTRSPGKIGVKLESVVVNNARGVN